MAGIGPKRPDLQVKSAGFPELIKRTLSLPSPARSLPFVDHFVDHAYGRLLAARGAELDFGAIKF